MDFTQFIKAELLILIPVLYGLGAILKHTEKINDKYIPLILTGAGLLLSCLYVLGTEGINSVSIFTAIVQGILVTAAAVYSNQLYKQSKQ